MASPTSSCSSSHSSPFSSSKFSSLPIMALREKIVEKILENRITLIVGETGCGKSSQVPQFLLEEGLQPIICTQPRRFAVVAVAKMVAKVRNSEVGGEVGYHIGHSRHMSERSKIVFKTAGVLLEELREKGMNALKYKAIILDEVHERSVESDLILVCLKQFLMKNNDLRVVLMSATADISRYREYFKDLGRGEQVEVFAIPSSNNKTIFQRSESYLEQITESLGISSEMLSLKYCSGPSPSTAVADMKADVHKLIHKLVLHIHENELDIEKSILVFLPTYRSLENQWNLLKPLSSSFKVLILHSSIETEQALEAMKIWKSHRKVILATNIAESSVTIPKVAFVIDSCRSLQVFWDQKRKKESSVLVWESKSQAEQRKGRTGRTCDGKVYRLVTRSFFSQLEKYECPSILKLSLRQQVLMICCAEAKAINDPKALLQRALDPPDHGVVEDALNLLLRMQALDKIPPRFRYEPTFYGRLLASFALSFDASVLILKFGDVGMLREGIVLGILMDTQPLPILRHFGEEQLSAGYIDCYFGGDNNSVLTGRREVELIGNFCAFQFWQRALKDKHRLEHLKQVLKFDGIKTTTALMPKIEEEWCSYHNLVQSSLHHVSEIYEEVLSSVHRYRPKFLATSNGLPSYYYPYEFEHTCLPEFEPSRDRNAVAVEDEHVEPSSETRRCHAIPYVPSNHFQTNDVVEKFATAIKEIKVKYTEEKPGDQQRTFFNREAPLCVYSMNGSCNRGSECLFSHSPLANRPSCKFFLSFQGCRNGDSCSFSHDLGSSVSSGSTSCLPEGSNVNAESLLRLFPTSSDGRILVLDDLDLRYSSDLARYCHPSKIICTTCLSETSISDRTLSGATILWGLRHPYGIIIKGEKSPVAWKKVKCVLWFPSFDACENLDEEKALLQNFFEFLAIRILADSLSEMQVILVMKNIRFSQLQGERLGRDCFFFLRESFPFDETSLGKLADTITTKKPLLMSRAITYVFNLHPPSNLQFGDYAATFRELLYGKQEDS